MAGLQILVLCVLVRIQLGQQKSVKRSVNIRNAFLFCAAIVFLMRGFFLFLFLFFSLSGFSQPPGYAQQNFCKNLNKVFELGRNDNFESYDGTMVKQSPFLPVPGYSIKLEGFPVNYADKDNRFVAKTNENMDSLSALKKLEELKTFVGYCLDSMQWKKWEEVNGNDSATVFLKELKKARATTKDLTLNIAIIIAAPKVYSVAMYVKRRR